MTQVGPDEYTFHYEGRNFGFVIISDKVHPERDLCNVLLKQFNVVISLSTGKKLLKHARSII